MKLKDSQVISGKIDEMQSPAQIMIVARHLLRQFFQFDCSTIVMYPWKCFD